MTSRDDLQARERFSVHLEVESNTTLFSCTLFKLSYKKPNVGSSKGKCIISNRTTPTTTTAKCGYCEVETSISCNIDSDCPVSSGAFVCNSATVCVEGSGELCVGDTCLVDSDCLPNDGYPRGKCQEDLSTTTCIISGCSPTAQTSSGNPTHIRRRLQDLPVLEKSRTLPLENW